MSWTEPRFLDRNLFLRRGRLHQKLRLYASRRLHDCRLRGFQGRRRPSLGGLPVTDEFSVGFNYTLMLDDVYNLDPNASLAVKQIAGEAVISSIGYNLIYDTRNNKAAREFYFKGTQDFAGAGGDVNYIRSTAEMRAYYPISDEITLAGRTTGGTIMGWAARAFASWTPFIRVAKPFPDLRPPVLVRAMRQPAMRWAPRPSIPRQRSCVTRFRSCRKPWPQRRRIYGRGQRLWHGCAKIRRRLRGPARHGEHTRHLRFVGFEVVRRHKPHLGFAGRPVARGLFLRPEQGRLRQDAGVRLRL